VLDSFGMSRFWDEVSDIFEMSRFWDEVLDIFEMSRRWTLTSGLPDVTFSNQKSEFG
jgi:hypothetical protein